MTMGLHACQYCTYMHIQSDFDQQHSTQHCMKGETDNSHFVSMHVYMHLAFKELNHKVIWPSVMKLSSVTQFRNPWSPIKTSVLIM